jgi:molecular chaperone DnaK (HSP70)
LIGGGTRIPIIINTLNEVFNMEPSRTINSSECAAKGAALISAMNSSIFKVHQYAFFNVNSYDVDLKVNKNLLSKHLISKN